MLPMLKKILWIKPSELKYDYKGYLEKIQCKPPTEKSALVKYNSHLGWDFVGDCTITLQGAIQFQWYLVNKGKVENLYKTCLLYTSRCV